MSMIPAGAVCGESQVLAVLERRIAECGTAKEFAAHFGLSQQFVSDVRKGKRPVTKALARRLGFDKQSIFIATEALVFRHDSVSNSGGAPLPVAEGDVQ